MAKLDLPPDTLTFGEALERLRKNPNDPDLELQELKKTLDGIAENLASTQEQMQAQLNNMVETIQAVMPQAAASLQNLRGFVQTDYFKRTLETLADPPTPIGRQLKYLSPLEDSQNIRLARIENYLERLVEAEETDIPLTDQEILLKAIPERNRKYKNARRVASLLLGSGQVDNWLIAQRLNPTISSIVTYKSRKFYKKDYLSKKDIYNQQIQNCFRRLKKFWDPLGYTIKFHSTYSELVSLEE